MKKLAHAPLVDFLLKYAQDVAKSRVNNERIEKRLQLLSTKFESLGPSADTQAAARSAKLKAGKLAEATGPLCEFIIELKKLAAVCGAGVGRHPMYTALLDRVTKYSDDVVDAVERSFLERLNAAVASWFEIGILKLSDDFNKSDKMEQKLDSLIMDAEAVDIHAFAPAFTDKSEKTEEAWFSRMEAVVVNQHLTITRK